MREPRSRDSVRLGGGGVDGEEGHFPERGNARVPGGRDIGLLTGLVNHVLAEGLRAIPEVPAKRALSTDKFTDAMVFTIRHKSLRSLGYRIRSSRL